MQDNMATLSLVSALTFCLSLTGVTAASADTVDETNIFNADLSTPAIKSAVMGFESVCLPFIAHETELTQDQDRVVFQSRMIEAGYDFELEGKKTYRHIPLRQFDFGAGCTSKPFPEIVTEGNYTTFIGADPVNDEPGPTWVVPHEPYTIDSSQITVLETCEMPRRFTPTRKHAYIRDLYKKRTDPATYVSLRWQDISVSIEAVRRQYAMGHRSPTIKLRTKFPPAGGCEFTTVDTALDINLVETSIIQFDEDWTFNPVKINSQGKDTGVISKHWSQCSTQDGEHYLYSLSAGGQSVQLKVETLPDDAAAASHNCRPVDALN